MDLIGSQTLAASRASVWQALNDPEVLKACIPGCDSVVRESESTFAVAMTAVVGPVKARFKARLSLSDVVAPERYTLTFDGQGGPAGYSKGQSTVTLSALDATSTRLDYTVNAQIGGKLAQVGQRLIDAAAKKVAEDFFSRFRAQVVPPEPEPAAVMAPAAAPDRPGGAIGWVVAALLAGLALLGYLGRVA
jgi:hypothetical protein